MYCWLIFFSNNKIWVVVCGLSDDVVLLYSNIEGFVVRVWVILICCFCLLDNLFGKLWFLFFNLMKFSSFVICFWMNFLFFFNKISGIVIFLKIVFDFSKLKFWNIMLIFFFNNWSCFWLKLCRFLLLIIILLVVGFFSELIMCNKVFFFVLL